MNRSCVKTLVLGLVMSALVSSCAAGASDESQPRLGAARLQHDDEHPEHGGPPESYFYGAQCDQSQERAAVLGVPWLPFQNRCGVLEETDESE